MHIHIFIVFYYYCLNISKCKFNVIIKKKIHCKNKVFCRRVNIKSLFHFSTDFFQQQIIIQFECVCITFYIMQKTYTYFHPAINKMLVVRNVESKTTGKNPVKSQT